MPINQLSQSNTFAQWLAATQGLIEKSNAYEGTTNLVFETANNVSNVYTNTVSVYNNTVIVFTDTSNVYLNTVSVYSNTFNVYTDIQTYVGSAYDTANTVNSTANQANTTAYQALTIAQAANAIVNNVDIVAVSFRANAAYDAANAATNTAQAAFTKANAAFDKANTFSQNTFVKIAVSGQSDIDASSNSSIVNFAPGANVTITTDSGTNTITIDSVGGSTATGDVNPTPNTVVQRDGSGDAYANNFISSSDARLKNNVRPIENAVDIVSQLEGVHFTWRDSGAEQIGLIAQEVEKVLPQIVYGTDPKSINYPVMVAVLIQAIKELNERVKTLENK